MINENQRNFLNNLPPDKQNRIVHVYPWDPHGLALADEIISEIKKADPDLEVLLTGSAALKIAGERDLDITGISPKAEHESHTKKLAGLLGPPISIGKSHVGWSFEKDVYNISFYIGDLSSPNALEQMQLFELLLASPSLAKEYEQIKLTNDGKTYREYQEAKYEFFNRILETT